MHETFADRICRSLDGAVREEPFGPGMVVWTIAGHMFAAYTVPGQGVSVRVQNAEAAVLLARGAASSRPDLAGAGWVLIPWTTPPAVLHRHVAMSYGLVLRDGNGARAG